MVDRAMTTMELTETQETELGTNTDAEEKPRRQRADWVKLLKDPHTRRLVAGQLGIRAQALQPNADPGGLSAEEEADNDLAELCRDVAQALRADR